MASHYTTVMQVIKYLPHELPADVDMDKPTYTPPPGHIPFICCNLTRDSDTLLGYFLKGTYTSHPETDDTVCHLSLHHHPGTPSSSYTFSPGITHFIRYSPTRGSDTSDTYVLPTTSTKSPIPNVTTTRATSQTKKKPTQPSLHTPSSQPHVTLEEPKRQAYHGSDTSHTYVLPTTSTKSPIPKVTTTRATSQTKKKPTQPSLHTPSSQPHVMLEEPKRQAYIIMIDMPCFRA